MPSMKNEEIINNIDKPTILIIEDDTSTRYYLKEVFKSTHNILFAKDGKEGIERAIKEIPDIIICDVMMPKMNGFDCCQLLKNNPKTSSIPIIFLTALADEENTINGIEIGGDDYQVKPIKPNIIRARVNQLINSRKKLINNIVSSNSHSEKDIITFSEELLEKSPFIANLNYIINENLSDPDFTVNKMTKILNMSQPTLYRKVKYFTGLSIAELIKNIRIKYSSNLLKSNLYSVQEVANMVGYTDVQTFRKHFTEAYGCTPSKYMLKI